MTEAATDQTTPDYSDLIGQTFHYIGSTAMLTPSPVDHPAISGVAQFGTELTATSTMLRNGEDRNGRNVFAEMLRSEDAQLARYSEIRWRKGPWPADVLRTRPGSAERIEQAQAGRAKAMRIRDLDDRAAELSRLRQVYGDDALALRTSSRTLAIYGDSR